VRIREINHITINMKDVEGSYRFYKDILEFQKLETIDMGDHELNYFALPGGLRLELIRYKGVQKALQTNPTDKGIYRHIAFTVDDLDEVEKCLKKEGVEIVVSALDLPRLGFKIILVKDPNGVEIEFMEKVKQNKGIN
jgi:catechol 2,3-dioxygenase-like lactoylglutathione lyase family enzyme